MLKSLVVWTLMATAAVAADGEYAAVTKSDAALRGAPSLESEQIGTVPANTTLAANVCFDEGAYCHVNAPGIEGYVAGDLLTIKGDTNSVLTAEKARWELIRKNAERPASSKFETDNIVVWGDSLSYDTFGVELARLLPGRDVSMQGVPGQDGKQIADRMLADTKYNDRLKVIWDRHWTNETPEQYLRELKPMIDQAAKTGDFIVVSDIRQIAGDIDLVNDLATTDEINRTLSGLYGDHFVDVSKLVEPAAMRASDGLHLSKAGYSVVARTLAMAIAARGAVAAQ